MSKIELKGFRNLHGLDTLIEETKEHTSFKENIFNIEINCLISGKYQPRSAMDDESLQELAKSIHSQGILLPLIVRRLSNDQFEIIAGERRWRAAKLVGLRTVPAVIKDISDQTACAFALIENIQRESLSAIEEAVALERLISEFGLTHEEVAERVGRSRSAVTNLIRLLELDEEVKELLRHKKIEMGHARSLLSLDCQKQRELSSLIVLKNLSVRNTEQLVNKIKSTSDFQSQATQHPYQHQIRIWENEFAQKIPSVVKIQLNEKGEGKIVIAIRSPEEIDWIIKNIL